MRYSRNALVSLIFHLDPLERAWTELELAPGFLVRSAPKPHRVVDRVRTRRPKRFFFADARQRRCSRSTRERRQPHVLRRRVSIDVVRSWRALQRSGGRPGRIVYLHEAEDALAFTDNRNLLLPNLITNIALAGIPGAGTVEESVTLGADSSRGAAAAA